MSLWGPWTFLERQWWEDRSPYSHYRLFKVFTYSGTNKWVFWGKADKNESRAWLLMLKNKNKNKLLRKQNCYLPRRSATYNLYHSRNKDTDALYHLRTQMQTKRTKSQPRTCAWELCLDSITGSVGSRSKATANAVMFWWCLG
jgi:hypothetical protein